jgi:ribose-phosphate pyrophosphokinase
MKIFSGSSNLPLAKKISDEIHQPLGDVILKQFADGESFTEFPYSMRGEYVAIIQSFSRPVNDNLMQAWAMTDALKRSGARRITLVAPYLAYSRQDRRSSISRSPITAKMIAELSQTAGIKQIITTDVHNLSIEGFYDIPFMNASTAHLFADDIRQRHEISDTVIVSPDAGGVGRARQVAKELDLDVAIVDKRRERANQIESMRLIGDVNGKNAIIIDDIVDTCRTILKCVEMLSERGAKSVRVYVSHGIFSKDALKNISQSPLTEIVLTDSIKNSKADKIEKIRRVSIATILAETMRRSVER